MFFTLSATSFIENHYINNFNYILGWWELWFMVSSWFMRYDPRTLRSDPRALRSNLRDWNIWPIFLMKNNEILDLFINSKKWNVITFTEYVITFTRNVNTFLLNASSQSLLAKFRNVFCLAAKFIEIQLLDFSIEWIIFTFHVSF